MNWLVPVAWFRALYAELLGTDSGPLGPEARLALVATAAVVAVAIACSLLGYRDTDPAGHAYSGGLAWLRLGAPSIPHALFWGPLATVLHIALALAVALVTVEWLFLGLPKVPFTCTYQPGKANLRDTWPIYAAVLALYCLLLPALAPWVEARPVGWAVSVWGLLPAWAWLVRLRARQSAAGRLVIDDAAAPYVTVLGRQWREAADRMRAPRS